MQVNNTKNAFLNMQEPKRWKNEEKMKENLDNISESP